MNYKINSLLIGLVMLFSVNAMDEKEWLKKCTQRVDEFINTGEELLIEACIHREGTSLVKKLLENKVDPNKMPEVEYPALHMACQYNNAATVQLLLDNKADVNLKEKWQSKTPLHFVTKVVFLNIADILLKEMPDLTMQDFLGNTPLHCIVVYQAWLYGDYSGRLDLMKKLINMGANPYIKNKRCIGEDVYEPNKNVYELIQDEWGAQECIEIKKYRSELRFNACLWLVKGKLPQDIIKLIVNSVYPEKPKE